MRCSGDLHKGVGSSGLHEASSQSMRTPGDQLDTHGSHSQKPTTLRPGCRGGRGFAHSVTRASLPVPVAGRSASHRKPVKPADTSVSVSADDPVHKQPEPSNQEQTAQPRTMENHLSQEEDQLNESAPSPTAAHHPVLEFTLLISEAPLQTSTSGVTHTRAHTHSTQDR